MRISDIMIIESREGPILGLTANHFNRKYKKKRSIEFSILN